MGLSEVTVRLRFYEHCEPAGVTLYSTFEDVLVDTKPLGPTGVESLLVAEGGEVTAVLGTMLAATIGRVEPGVPLRLPLLNASSPTCQAPREVVVSIAGAAAGNFVDAGWGCRNIDSSNPFFAEIDEHCQRLDGSTTLFHDADGRYGAVTNVGLATTAATIVMRDRVATMVDVATIIPAEMALGGGSETDVVPLHDRLPIAKFSRVSVFPTTNSAYTTAHDLDVSEADALRHDERHSDSDGWNVEFSRVLGLSTSLSFTTADWTRMCDVGSVVREGSIVRWDESCEGADILIVGSDFPRRWTGFYPAGATNIRLPLVPGFDLVDVGVGVIDTTPDLTAADAGLVYDHKRRPDEVFKSYRSPLYPLAF